MTVLQFEWVCQNVDKLKSFREAVGVRAEGMFAVLYVLAYPIFP